MKPGVSLIIGFVDKESALGKLYLQHKNESLFYGIATFYSVDEIIFYLKKLVLKIILLRKRYFIL